MSSEWNTTGGRFETGDPAAVRRLSDTAAGVAAQTQWRSARGDNRRLDSAACPSGGTPLKSESTVSAGQYGTRRFFLLILPVAVFGSDSRNSTDRGTL
jgi:hypothetical protein